MSTGSDFSDSPMYAPWATAGSQDSSAYSPTTEDTTNDLPILQITTRAEHTRRPTPSGSHLTESDEELLLASEQYEALQYDAHTRSLEDWAYNTILQTDDPVLRQLWHAEAPVLEMIILYITDIARHSNTLSGNPHNAWPWYHTEWMSATFLLQQLRLRMTTYHPHVWSTLHRTVHAETEASMWDRYISMYDKIALLKKQHETTTGNATSPTELSLTHFIALEDANTTPSAPNLA